MKPYPFLSLLLLPALFMAGCQSKTHDEPLPYYGITESQLVDATNIKPGSYFIYADSATSLTDSFYCVASNHSTVTDLLPSKTKASFEVVNYTLQTATGYSMYFYGRQYYLQWSFTHRAETGTSQCLVLPFVTGRLSQPEPNAYPTTCIAYYDTLAIAGQSYHQVHQLSGFTPIYSSVTTNSDTVYLNTWYSIPSGIVKYTTQSKKGYHAWQLVRSYVVR